MTITAAGRGSIARICRIAVRRFSGWAGPSACASPMWVSLRIAIVLRRCRIRR